MNRDYAVSVRLLSADGATVADSTSKPGRGDVATSTWAVGRTLRDTHYLTLPAQLPESLSLVVLVGETDSAGGLRPIAPAGGQVLKTWTLQYP